MIEEPKMKKIIGLRNIVTDKETWKYLLFYDIDSPTEADIKNLVEYLDELKCISYIIYSTKAGLHVVGLTPLNSSMWGVIFAQLQIRFPEYYSGQTIRLSRKENEKQELIYSNLEYPIIPNLLELYSKRFFQNESKAFFEEFQENLIYDNHWSLVFERYWSQKT
jgi:hypothetical protein